MLNGEQITNLLTIIAVAYPNVKMPETEATAILWHDMFVNYSYKDVSNGLKSYMATETTGFPPSIGQIIEQIKKLKKKPNELSEGQVWDVVYKAICNSGYNSVYEFNNLPADIQKSVGSSQQLHEWSQMDKDDLEKVGKSQFLRSYRANKERQEYLDSLPADVTARLENNEDVKKLTDEGEN